MPVDPTISLGASASGVPASANSLAAGGAGLDMVSKFAGIQNALNQNRLFQQTFEARTRAGQIISSAPDLETGLALLYKDPGTAAFAGQITNDIRQSQKIGLDMAKTRQEMGQSAAVNLTKGLVGALGNPEQFESLVNAGLSTVPPEVRPQVESYVNSIKTSLTAGLPQGTDQKSIEARNNKIQSGIGGLLMSSGISPEVVNRMTGAGFRENLGGQIVGGGQAPVWGGRGGAISPAGAGLATSPVPRVGVEPLYPGGAPGPVQLGGAGGLGGVGAPGGSNPLINPSPAAAAPALGQTQEQAKANEGAGAAAGEISSEMATRAQSLPTSINRINLMTDSLGQFQAGGGADFRAQISKGMQALKNAGLHISDESINRVGNSDLAATQVFNSQVKPYVIGQLKEVAQGTGRVMRTEVDAFIASLNATTDPKAIMHILNLAKKSLQIGYDQSMRYTDYRQMLASGHPEVKGLGPSDFYSWYYKNPKDLQSPPSMDLGPSPLSSAKGAVADKEWILKGGKLVPAGATAP